MECFAREPRSLLRGLLYSTPGFLLRLFLRFLLLEHADLQFKMLGSKLHVELRVLGEELVDLRPRHADRTGHRQVGHVRVMLGAASVVPEKLATDLARIGFDYYSRAHDTVCIQDRAKLAWRDRSRVTDVLVCSKVPQRNCLRDRILRDMKKALSETLGQHFQVLLEILEVLLPVYYRISYSQQRRYKSCL